MTLSRTQRDNASSLFDLCAVRNRDGVEMHWGMVQKLVDIAYKHGDVIAKAIRALPVSDGEP